ncbi:hypothetical protein KP509_03G066400 [Ceratopteris richardii]|nr:hypothetical protein KP509_03G066400 [Ceratopteris richardii]
MSNKRQRLEISKRQANRWEDEQAIVASTNSPSNAPRQGQDLRHKLHQKHKQNQHISNASTIVGNDLRARISGSIPQDQGQRIVVHRHPPIPTKPLPLVGPLSPPNAITSHVKPLQKVEQPTVGMLLQSLGLGKYSITFQAEEIDMTALRNMNDDDLKELGLPMGPRKKILLALSRK